MREIRGDDIPMIFSKTNDASLIGLYRRRANWPLRLHRGLNKKDAIDSAGT